MRRIQSEAEFLRKVSPDVAVSRDHGLHVHPVVVDVPLVDLVVALRRHFCDGQFLGLFRLLPTVWAGFLLQVGVQHRSLCFEARVGRAEIGSVDRVDTVPTVPIVGENVELLLELLCVLLSRILHWLDVTLTVAAAALEVAG